MADKIKVMIVDDSAIVRQVASEAIAALKSTTKAFVASGGMSMVFPDVCKTPAPPAPPVPIPYPNIASQSTLQNGTTTVKAKGQMIAVKGSQYSSSNGDEAGTAGGVKSGVNMKATDWITYSFDVTTSTKAVSDLTIDQTPMGWTDSGVTTDTAACSINKQ